MSSTAPNVPTPRKHTPGSPLWATVLDRSLPFVLASAGLLVPDHVGTFYLALLVGFVGIAGVVLTRVNVKQHARAGYGDAALSYTKYGRYYSS